MKNNNSVLQRRLFFQLNLLEEEMEKIILIGVPGSGKSTLGRRVADVMQLPFFDTDTLMIEKIKSDRLADFIRMAFNGQFLIAQKKIMTELSHHKGPAIISTGAEVALIPECAALMKKMGTIIHIQRKPEIVLEDMRKDSRKGVVMTVNGKEVDRHEETIRLYMEDYSEYEVLADLTLENNGTEDEGLEKLVNMLSSL
jgi:shikimate kinase